VDEAARRCERSFSIPLRGSRRSCGLFQFSALWLVQDCIRRHYYAGGHQSAQQDGGQRRLAAQSSVVEKLHALLKEDELRDAALLDCRSAPPQTNLRHISWLV
jgi:hypothetical protein